MLTQQDIRNLKPTDSEYKRGCGNGLYVVIDKKFVGKDGKKYGGGKYFKGKFQGSYAHVGTFGNRYGELSLNDASEEWNTIKEWSKRTGQKVKRYREHQQLKVCSSTTLQGFPKYEDQDMIHRPELNLC